MTGRGVRPASWSCEQPSDVTRQAVRHIASGVTVLTVDLAGLRHGTTASAVVAVSRVPLVLGVCLRPSSTLASMLRPVGRFAVNVLAAGQEDVARRFADPDRPRGDAQFSGLDWTVDRATGAPLLDGCLAHLGCRTLGWQQVGDHTLLLAEVLEGSHATGAPMLSFDRQTHRAVPTDPIDPSPLNEVS